MRRERLSHPVVKRTLAIVLLTCQWQVARAADWTHWAGDSAHRGIATRAPDRLTDVAWTAAPLTLVGQREEFVWRSSVVVADGRVFLVGRRFVDDGTGQFDHVANIVICYDAEDGARLWDTLIAPDIFDSWATPAIDRSAGAILVAAQSSMFALRISDGFILWERELPQLLVNASPTVSDDLVNHGAAANRAFITDYTGFATAGGGIYAINVSPYDAHGNPYEPGEIVWQDRTLPGTSGNTVAYSDGFVYVSTTHGGVIRCYAARDGGASGGVAIPEWETDTGISAVDRYAGFYGGVTVRNGHVYAAAYNFFGTGNTSRLYKLAADGGALIWTQPCERTDAIPVVSDTGRIFLSAGIEGFGSAVKIQAFQDNGASATLLWDTFLDSAGSLVVGGWTHQPLLADGLLYCGTPNESQFFAPYTTLYILDTNHAPGDPGFMVAQAAGSGGSPAAADGNLFSIGNAGLTAYRGWRLGDVNCDGSVNFQDIDAFVLALSGRAAYEAAYPNCRYVNADANDDGGVDFDDIDAFVVLLVGE